MIRIYIINDHKIEITDENNNSTEIEGAVLDLTLKELKQLLRESDD